MKKCVISNYINEFSKIIKDVTYDTSLLPSKTSCTIELINGEKFKGEYYTFGTCMAISFFKEESYNAAINEMINYFINKIINAIVDESNYGIRIPIDEFLNKFPIGINKKNISNILIKNQNIEIKLKESHK